jgi:cytochrome c-type biogenesis protein CcmH/NrfG
VYFRLTPRVRRGAFLFLLGAALGLPAHAQKGKKDSKAAAPPSGPQRLQPLYGGLTAAQAQQAVGANVLADIDRSFPSRPEASKFFSTKGFEYLQENKPDTAVVRFNLAWVLDPKNPETYRGLAVLLSRRPDASPEAIQALLLQGLAVAPTNSLLLTDAANTALARYEEGKKKKELQQASDYVQRALQADGTNANAWQAQARILYYQEKYAEAWQAVHKGQNLNLASLDFQFLTELMAKQPDPEGKFK